MAGALGLGAPFGMPTAAPLGTNGPWVYGPTNHAGMVGFAAQPGEFLEVLVYDATGMPTATAVFTTTQSYPADARGAFVEVQYVGCSGPAVATMLQQVFAAPGASVLHLCSQATGLCHAHVVWPGRHVLHSDLVRRRAPSTLTEGWLPAHIQAGAVLASVAHATGPLVGGIGAGPAPPQAQLPPAGAAPAGPAAIAPAAADAAASAGTAKPLETPTAEELKKKVEELRERLKKKRGIGHSLLDNALKHKKRRRKKTRRNDSDSGSDSESVFDGAPSRSKSIPEASRENPGVLFTNGMQQIKRYLAQRGGAEDSETDNLAATVVQYITSVWHGLHPPGEMGVRNCREMRTVGECLDALLRGDLASLGDLLMQRLKAIEQATKDGHWQVARHLEVCDTTELGLATDLEVQTAVNRQIRDGKLKDAISTSNKK